MSKLPGENGEELAENGSGKDERVLPRNYSAERLARLKTQGPTPECFVSNTTLCLQVPLQVFLGQNSLLFRPLTPVTLQCFQLFPQTRGPSREAGR